MKRTTGNGIGMSLETMVRRYVDLGILDRQKLQRHWCDRSGPQKHQLLQTIEIQHFKGQTDKFQ